MSADGQIDERMRAALARLTENEKACLRRRLLPQTAKEMAIELNVSPHAVEKRLKMARTKLGLSSSLEAARLLAAVEGYQPPVPRPPDLVAEGEPGKTGPHAGADKLRWIGPIAGGVTMILILAAALALGLPQTQPAVPDAKALAEATALLAETFKSLDRNHSGFLEPREAGALEPRNEQRDKMLGAAPADGTSDPAAEKKWLDKLDNDRDGRVSRQEYTEYMTPWILLHGGVPRDWKQKP